MLGTHVDDDLMTGDEQWFTEVVPELQRAFPYGKWKDSCENNVFVHTGRTIEIFQNYVRISQRDYVESLRRIY
eukprot:6323643-Alexandrium_andersonii.AAC.1